MDAAREAPEAVVESRASNNRPAAEAPASSSAEIAGTASADQAKLESGTQTLAADDAAPGAPGAPASATAPVTPQPVLSAQALPVTPPAEVLPSLASPGAAAVRPHVGTPADPATGHTTYLEGAESGRPPAGFDVAFGLRIRNHQPQQEVEHSATAAQPARAEFQLSDALPRASQAAAVGGTTSESEGSASTDLAQQRHPIPAGHDAGEPDRAAQPLPVEPGFGNGFSNLTQQNHGAAALAASAAPETRPANQPSAPPRPVAEPAVPAPEPHQSAVKSDPVSRLSLEVAADNQGRVNIHLHERDGEVRVTVRAADARLADGLRGELSTLLHSLQRAGFQAEVWQPPSADPGGSRHDGSAAHDESHQGHPQGRHSQERGDRESQPRWLEEFHNRVADSPAPKGSEVPRW